MRVNIVIKDSEKGWILYRTAEELQKRLSYIDINGTSDDYDITYFIPYYIAHEKAPGKKVALFTHLEEQIPEIKQKFFDTAKFMDHSIFLSRKYEKLIRKTGVKNTIEIPLGIDLEKFKPKLKLGFIGRLYSHTTRKGPELLEQVNKLEFVDLKTTEGKLTEEEMPDFFRSLDYVLITSKYEGIPMCLIEGLACGVEIIAPKDLGMVSEFKKGILHYKNSDFNSLKKVLEKAFSKKLKLRKQVENLSWDTCARRHDELFRRMCQCKNL